MLLFPFAAFLLCFSTVLSGYCIFSFYFLGILGVMKLHHSELVHGMFKLRKHGRKTYVRNMLRSPERSSIFSMPASYQSFQYIDLPSIFICLLFHKISMGNQMVKSETRE